MPSAAQLNEWLAQVGDCRTRGHRIRLKVGQGFVVREEGLDRGVRGGVLGWYNPGALPPGA
jgi:tRNA(Ile)-lysidine synthase